MNRLRKIFKKKRKYREPIGYKFSNKPVILNNNWIKNLRGIKDDKVVNQPRVLDDCWELL